MAEEAKCIIMQLSPKLQELRDERTYSVPEVKDILFGFARDLGCKWSDEELHEFIETVFE